MQKKNPLSFLVNLHTNLSFTCGTSKNNVNFSDLNIRLRNGAIHTDLYIKPTDGHQYLHYQSSHAQHTKVSIPYSQALRVSRICSPENDFKTCICRKEECFLAKRYPENVVNDQTDKIVFCKNPPVKKFSETGITFVPTYHQKLKDLGKLIKDLLPFLYSDEENKEVSSPPTLKSYRSSRKVKDYIARSKLYPVERRVDCPG